MFRRASRVLGIALSVALFAWVLYIADVRRLLQFLAETSISAFVLTVLLGYLAIPLRVLQWQLLLGRAPEVTNYIALKSICLGHLGNFLLPMRGGELVRTVVMARATGIPIPRVLVSMVLSRIQDLPVIACVLGIFFIFVPVSTEAVDRSGEIMGIVLPSISTELSLASHLMAVSALASAVGLLFCYRLSGRIVDFIKRTSSLVPHRFSSPLVRFFEGVDEGMRVVGDTSYFWASQVISALCWVIYTVSPVPLLLAFGMDFKTACLTALSKTAITTVAHLLPSAPGTIGTFHAFCLVSVLAVNPQMDTDAALAYVFLAHIISVLSPAIPGLLFLPAASNEFFNIRLASLGEATKTVSKR